MKILIVESNTPALLAKGRSGAESFVRTLLALAPEATLEIVAPYAAEPDRFDFDAADGVIFTGSGVEWSTEAPEAEPLRRAMECAFDKRKPIWGSCNGLQLAAVVLGGAVGESPNGREDGLARDLEILLPHAMLTGRVAGFAVPCVHRDEVTRVPVGARVVAGNSHSPVQAMVYEKDGLTFWGTQYHPEMTLDDVARCLWDKGAAKHLRQAAASETVAEALGTTVEAQQTSVRTLELQNWLTLVAACAASGSAGRQIA